MAETVYEGMFLLDSNRYAREPEEVADQIPRIIQQAGGHMLVSRLWEERRLAFSVKGRRKGTYWLTYFRIDGNRLAEVKRECRLSDSILRVLFVKIDPRIVDTLVEHARTGQVKPVSERAAVEAAKATGKPDQEQEAAKATGKPDQEQEEDESPVTKGAGSDQPASEAGHG